MLKTDIFVNKNIIIAHIIKTDIDPSKERLDLPVNEYTPYLCLPNLAPIGSAITITKCNTLIPIYIAILPITVGASTINI